ncbi:MAG: tRNA (5-methylaminomethyl-2-thiouridine)(34)-methyltransferase MnmD [Bacteroidota bacterium]
MNISPEVIITGDGSKTLYLVGMNEQFHSVKGALTESRHVFIQHGLLYRKPFPGIRVLEAGFGTGLNALLTAWYAITSHTAVNYRGLEKFPLGKNILDKLDHGSFAGEKGRELYRKIHDSKWDTEEELDIWFRLTKMECDMTAYVPDPEFSPDVVYFDAFGPDKQPEVWELRVFEMLYQSMAPQGVLVTYSAKGEVRRRLISAGFAVERLPGPPGKREMLRAIKK